VEGYDEVFGRIADCVQVSTNQQWQEMLIAEARGPTDDTRNINWCGPGLDEWTVEAPARVYGCQCTLADINEE
jgi:hypothetical protein